MHIFSLITTLLLAVAYASATLSVSMKQLPDETIRVSVANNGCQDVKLLRDPNSALRTDLPTHKFSFSSMDGSSLPMFSGIETQWSPLAAKYIDEAFVTIPAHGSVDFDHNLLEAYTFAASRKLQQTFTITLTQSSFTTYDSMIRFSTPSLTITLSVRKASRLPSVLYPLANDGHRCESADLAFLQQEAIHAGQLAQNASNYFGHLPLDPQRYYTWFGEWTYTRALSVAKRLGQLEDAGLVMFTCTCDKTDIYAYVDPHDRWLTINVCPLFWKAPMVGKDSQIGIILNQASRFAKFGLAKDLASGHDDCKKLAKSDPDSAIKNAGSFQYFAENTPFLK